MANTPQSPEVAELIEDLRAVYREALDYLDHAGLAEFADAEERTRGRWVEEVETIQASNTRQRALRNKRGLIT